MWNLIKKFVKPHFIIGQPEAPYLLRWYLIPRNRYFNIYLHKFLRSDDDRALHDHPWWFVSFMLKGTYQEITDKGTSIRKAGSFLFRKALDRHRVELIDNKHCWTLFITGKKVRDWGFWCPKGFVPWQQFCDHNDRGNIGKGCD
jgi:hypothetical protein